MFKSDFHARFDRLKWDQDEEKWERWQKGETGFPIVDAGMGQLSRTGFSNRVRMIVASFLVKDLHINWRRGEQYFAQKLIDYDPAINNGNWQWIASTGCDAQPYFRIFNPWLQQKKYDAEGNYIRTWVPELVPLTPSFLHVPDELAEKSQSVGYFLPLVNHEQEAQRARERYEAVVC